MKGGALATLFTADIGEYGIDAGRAMPTTRASEAWWKAVANTFWSATEKGGEPDTKPPRP